MSKKIIFFVSILTVGIFILFLFYMEYIQSEKKHLETEIYTNQAKFMEKNLASMIDEKKKATTAIAITLASNNLLPELIEHHQELEKKLNSLISNLKEYTNYKNIWIHILDRDLHSIYRSWTSIKDDSLCTKRDDLNYVLEKEQLLSVIGVDAFSISIKAIVPLYDKEHRLLGIIEVISHFNSIANGLKKLDIDSVVLVNKKESQYIQYPFTKMYIDGNYIANFNAPKKLLEYVKKHKIENYSKAFEHIENGYLIVSYPLKDFDGSVIAYYIMFQKLSFISKTGLNYFIFRWSIFAVLLLMALAGIINITLYFYIKKQKEYYKNILDTSNNIVLVNNKERIIDANKTFFKYFPEFKSVDEFRDKYGCICSLFVEEDEYLQKGKEEYSWLEHVLQNQEKKHKVKMKINDKIHYFMVYISLISAEQEHYSVIFADITDQEIYKQELEALSLHDPLTHVGNRRKYQKRIKEEIARACRYKTQFSLIEFDIDFFKKVNDTMGHMNGDRVLIEYSKLVVSLLRDVDELFRTGGEEFIIIAPHIDKEEASKLAEKLRKAIEEYKKVTTITASFGVTEFQNCETEEELFERVDYALYEAKNSGRNRVVVQ